jgi:hypothetical protein
MRALSLHLTALLTLGYALCLPRVAGAQEHADRTRPRVEVDTVEAASGPRFEEVVGRDFGERITLHHEMVRYLEALALRSPRVQVVQQGASWEGRALPYVIVTAPENLGRIEEIQAAAQRLGDPRRTSPDEARALIERQPVIAWLGGSIHGSELSGSEGVLKLLEHLTTRDDAETLDVLRNVVVQSGWPGGVRPDQPSAHRAPPDRRPRGLVQRLHALAVPQIPDGALLLRHEPRLVRAYAGGDTGPRRHPAALAPPDRHRPARAGA